MNGRAALEHAARHADTIGLTMLGRTLPDGQRHETRWEVDRLDRTVAFITEQARGRHRPLELHALVQTIIVTDERDEAVAEVVRQGWAPSRDDALATPFLAIGTHDEIARHLLDCRERWGISYFSVRDVEAFSPVIAARAGPIVRTFGLARQGTTRGEGTSMWPSAVARRLELDVPVIQAPMGGGPSTVELAAAVSSAGGMGSLAGAYLAPDRLRDDIRRLRSSTARPFAVNLFVPNDIVVTDAEIEHAVTLVEPYRTELGLAPRPTVTTWAEDFDAQLDVVIEARVPAFSFTMGIPTVDQLHRVRSSGAATIGTATTVAEARALVDGGVDIVCAQGAEAGGHRGSWLTDADDSLIGTLALVPLVCDAVRVPVVAAGGIMDGRGVAAALCLGAGAAQMGTAFMLCPEAGTTPPHRRAIEAAAETEVATTSVVTGRMARGVRNRLMTELRDEPVPPYPVMNALTTELRRVAAAHGDAQLMSLWCGQAAHLATHAPAAEIVLAISASVASIGREVLGGFDHDVDG